jgi:hypothetical protein
MICEQCETVAHCTKHGCVPKQPAPTEDKALKLALEALEAVLSDNQPYTHKSKAAITAIKQALAAPVQELEHIVHSNGRYSPLLTRMMNKRVESNVKQVIHLYDEPPAAPVQEPVASYKGPKELWLQLHGDCSDDELTEPVDYTDDSVTWCWHQIYNSDVRYVRADIATPPAAKVIRTRGDNA